MHDGNQSQKYSIKYLTMSSGWPLTLPVHLFSLFGFRNRALKKTVKCYNYIINKKDAVYKIPNNQSEKTPLKLTDDYSLSSSF